MTPQDLINAKRTQLVTSMEVCGKWPMNEAFRMLYMQVLELRVLVDALIDQREREDPHHNWDGE